MFKTHSFTWFTLFEPFIVTGFQKGWLLYWNCFQDCGDVIGRAGYIIHLNLNGFIRRNSRFKWKKYLSNIWNH